MFRNFTSPSTNALMHVRCALSKHCGCAYIQFPGGYSALLFISGYPFDSASVGFMIAVKLIPANKEEENRTNQEGEPTVNFLKE